MEAHAGSSEINPLQLYQHSLCCPVICSIKILSYRSWSLGASRRRVSLQQALEK
jgi:hypothetical protein